MSIFQNILGSLEARLSQPKISLWRTAYFNFRTLPLRQAIKMPVYIYGKVRLFMLNGKIQIKAPIKTGMISIGRNNESFALFDHSGFISLGSRTSRIVFEGQAQIAVNTKIRVPDGTLTFGEGAFIGAGVRIICNGSYIKIGDHNRIAFDTVIMNSGFHFVYNSSRESVGRLSHPIILGSYNWIGNRSTISSGTKTKPYTIVCSGSLLNKDYTKTPDEYEMLGGAPAKIISTGIRRVFNPILENEIIQWFRHHPNENNLHISQQEFDNNTLTQ